MKLLVDECVPVKLLRLLTGHEFTTALEQGWGSFKNRRLLALVEPAFELFLSCDRNLEYQQNLKGCKVAVLLLSTNHWPTLRRHAALVQSALDSAQAGRFLHVEIHKP